MIYMVFSGKLRGDTMARTTGLEPATSCVTGRHSNQLNYVRALVVFLLINMADERKGFLYFSPFPAKSG
jgi:hypothetical protein